MSEALAKTGRDLPDYRSGFGTRWVESLRNLHGDLLSSLLDPGAPPELTRQAARLASASPTDGLAGNTMLLPGRRCGRAATQAPASRRSARERRVMADGRGEIDAARCAARMSKWRRGLSSAAPSRHYYLCPARETIDVPRM